MMMLTTVTRTTALSGLLQWASRGVQRASAAGSSPPACAFQMEGTNGRPAMRKRRAVGRQSECQRAGSTHLVSLSPRKMPWDTSMPAVTGAPIARISSIDLA